MSPPCCLPSFDLSLKNFKIEKENENYILFFNAFQLPPNTKVKITFYNVLKPKPAAQSSEKMTSEEPYQGSLYEEGFLTSTETGFFFVLSPPTNQALKEHIQIAQKEKRSDLVDLSFSFLHNTPCHAEKFKSCKAFFEFKQSNPNTKLPL
jgi:hypothetical protein